MRQVGRDFHEDVGLVKQRGHVGRAGDHSGDRNVKGDDSESEEPQLLPCLEPAIQPVREAPVLAPVRHLQDRRQRAGKVGQGQK